MRGKRPTGSSIRQTDANALRYCGMMGHTYVVLISNDGNRSASFLTCDRERAIADAQQRPVCQAADVYHQVSPGKWVGVYVPKVKP